MYASKNPSCLLQLHHHAWYTMHSTLPKLTSLNCRRSNSAPSSSRSAAATSSWPRRTAVCRAPSIMSPSPAGNSTWTSTRRCDFSNLLFISPYLPLNVNIGCAVFDREDWRARCAAWPTPRRAACVCTGLHTRSATPARAAQACFARALQS